MKPIDYLLMASILLASGCGRDSHNVQKEPTHFARDALDEKARKDRLLNQSQDLTSRLTGTQNVASSQTAVNNYAPAHNNDLTPSLIIPSIAGSQTAVILWDQSSIAMGKETVSTSFHFAKELIEKTLKNPRFAEYHVLTGCSDGKIEYVMHFEKNEDADGRYERWKITSGKELGQKMITYRPFVWLEQASQLAKRMPFAEVFFITGDNTPCPQDLPADYMPSSTNAKHWKDAFKELQGRAPEFSLAIPINIIHVSQKGRFWQEKPFGAITNATVGKYTQVLTER